MKEKEGPEYYWKRAIIHMDMNAFFASVEQKDDLSLRGKPVAVTNGERGTCIITCSYEARAYGVRTGMRLREARRLCPQLIQRSARPKRYSSISSDIMRALLRITPDIEIFSVDEAFLEVTACQRLWGVPPVMAQMTKELVWVVAGLPCSVGLSGDKTTAKYATGLRKPDGLTIIPPWEAKARLCDVPVRALCGIGSGIERFLASYGVHRCGDMAHLPMSVLAKRFGNVGRRLWYMCQGADPEPLQLETAAPKSLGHGKIMPPGTTDREVVLTYLLHMCEKLSARLRKHDLEAQHFFIGLRHRTLGWMGGKFKTLYPTQDNRDVWGLCRHMLKTCWCEEPVYQVQITALDPRPKDLQMDLFMDKRKKEKRSEINNTIDKINQMYGEFTLAPARLLLRSDMPNVIAPSWKPTGVRQTIPTIGAIASPRSLPPRRRWVGK